MYTTVIAMSLHNKNENIRLASDGTLRALNILLTVAP